MSARPDPPTPAPAWHVLVPAGLAEVALLTALGWWPAAGAPAWRAALFAGAFTAYALAAARVKDSRGGTALIWIVAVALRLAMLPLDPALSNEAYRQLWDGHVQASGFGPFGRAPLHPELAGLHTPWLNLVPGAQEATPYPPLAQIAFLVVALAGGALFQAKLLWIGLDLATGWVLGRIAHGTGRSRRLTQLLWLWSPLLVVEVAWNAHHLPLALLPMALVVLLTRVPAASGVAMGLAGMAAPAALAGVPALLRRGGMRFLLGCLAGMALAGTPYVLAGSEILAAPLRPFLQSRYLEGPYLLLESAVPGTLAPRVAALAVILAVSAWAAWRRMRAEAALLWVSGAALLVTPVLAPWHALWILPFAALRRSWPWMLFTGLAFLPYLAHPAGPHHAAGPLPVWIHLAVWLPLLVLLAREGLRSWAGGFTSVRGPGT